MKLSLTKNYLTLIENAVKGENWMFRNLYAEIDGKEIDILKDGGLSCAFFVSSILYLSKMITDLHANVKSTEKDMIKFGWKEAKEPRPGAVLVWEKKVSSGDGQEHYHIGFYMGNDMAVSNSSRDTGFIAKHHYTYNGTRKIEKIYWHPSLEEKS
ncbi:MAG: hypothetical protein A3B99_02575 [Candidatus Yanofskybacteria bacterium RIFCSPHIGHO2_02_FULL_44_12b]|uniref:NlpC/P60 domain-containing protein n=2 Tax=Candidatus Yanofskyibacteriota TaxID=1752733 RepID=A0A1F8GKN8_9BACT|nr:MAG: hypothetical protein UW79_C0001G0012 [Candidatus Yanofskybacteria bacterium GW2011_GWA2_44_9]OGN04020.1 MAG: hypothetical protein A2659_00195 [Candidatus Yanofskybacteria bacterium RIFCSPHIGHO2_01_FULL_44_24]OGN15352.1 MAG: hypothetical protein A3B99_02575 [Candidatus Yanofskybacteria bacterium RIFCSPHIGHO2_02_FULL_44_12b]OGN25977.1 MAG: hypothetical protein A2925_04575 [Candidatus Yanofskybacteria bacterium RIFCSPLOWO2_01_FULL_44_22]